MHSNEHGLVNFKLYATNQKNQPIPYFIGRTG